jgi:DNA-binding transcriptional LysR family regulator
VELRQLEYFVAVADECHFTRAAKRVHVAQSGLSASIRSLESELGAPLFVRSTRQVELTEAGRALLVEARRAFGSVDAARDAVAAVQGLRRGTLSVGSLQCLHVVHLPAVLAAFHDAHPGVEIRLRQGGTADLVEEVRSGRVGVEVNDVHSLLDFVGFGLGVALVPQSFSVKTDMVQFVGLDGGPVAETVVVTGATVSAAARALLDLVRPG